MKNVFLILFTSLCAFGEIATNLHLWTSSQIGDTLRVTGYYAHNDGGGHLRVCSESDDGSGIQIQGSSEKYWNISPLYQEVSTSYFGLIGDGNTIETEKLSKAVNYGKKLISPSHKVYLIDKSIQINKNLHMDFGGSTIKCTPNFAFTPDSSDDNAYFTMLRGWDFTLTQDSCNKIYNNNNSLWQTKIVGTVFDGNEANLVNSFFGCEGIYSIYLGTGNVHIENCTFKHMPGGSISANAAVAICSNGQYVRNVNFFNNTVDSCGLIQKGVFGGFYSQASNNFVNNNRFSNIHDSPIAINGKSAENSIITNNVILNQYGDGIAFENGADNAVIANNYIENFGTSGINLKNFENSGGEPDYDKLTNENFLIANNIIKKGNPIDETYACEGIQVSNGKNVTISTNQISDIDKGSQDNHSGITIAGDNIQVISNDINVSTYALKIRGINHKIYANKLISNDITGIQSWGTTHNVEIRGNTINSSSECIKFMHGTIGNIIIAKDNVLVKKAVSVPLMVFPPSTINGRLSSNKIQCDKDGIFRRQLRKSSNLIIPSHSAMSVVLDDVRPWTPSDHLITKVSILSGDFVVDDPNILKTTTWANAFQTVVVNITNNHSVPVRINEVIVEIEGTRIEG